MILIEFAALVSVLVYNEVSYKSVLLAKELLRKSWDKSSHLPSVFESRLAASYGADLNHSSSCLSVHTGALSTA